MDWREIETLSDLGVFIRDARRKLGVTQTEFAKKIGVSHATLSALENGKCVASATLHKALHGVGYKALVVPEESEYTLKLS